MMTMHLEPELIGQAARDLTGIGSSLDDVMAAKAGHLTAVVPAASDEVSTAIAALFGKSGQEFQALNAQAAEFHNKFVNLMNSGLTAYSHTEDANGAVFTAGLVPVGAAGGSLGADLQGLAAQAGAFAGEELLDTGFTVGTVGNAIFNAGEVLSENGAGLSTVANIGVSNLSAAGLADVTIGRDLARIINAGPAGALLQTGGSAFQGIGEGLEVIGFADEILGAGPIQSF